MAWMEAGTLRSRRHDAEHSALLLATLASVPLLLASPAYPCWWGPLPSSHRLLAGGERSRRPAAPAAGTVPLSRYGPLLPHPLAERNALLAALKATAAFGPACSWVLLLHRCGSRACR